MTLKLDSTLTIVILLSVLVLLLSVRPRSLRLSREYFAEDQTPVLMSSFANHSAWVTRAGNYTWKPKEGTDDEVTNAAPGTLIVSYPQDNIKGAVRAEKKGYFVSLMSLPNAMFVDCGFNLGGMRVGYFDRGDLHFIQALMSGYRMDTSKVKLVKLSITKDILNLQQRLISDIDIIITFIVPKSPLHRLIQAQRVSVMGFRNIDIERVKVFYPSIKIEDVKLREMFFDIGRTGAKVLARENDTKLPTAQVTVLSVAPKKDNEEGFSNPEGTISANSYYVPDKDSLNPKFRCYGDESITIRALCDSEYDVTGQPKKYTVWDQPCETDTDCPFWDSSQQRGGCLKDGLCELPVAVQRLGYRKYNDEGVYASFKNNGKVIFPSING